MTANLRLRLCREPLPRLANHSPLCSSCAVLIHAAARLALLQKSEHSPLDPDCPHGCLPFLHFLITPLRVVCECLRKHKGPSQKARPLVTCKGQADSGVCSFVACLSWEALGIHPWASTCHRSPLPLSNSYSEGHVSSDRA